MASSDPDSKRAPEISPGSQNPPGPPQAVKAQTGRVLGPRALKTRERLLEATAELLREQGALDLSVVEIARRAGTSAATFYQYFSDVEEAALSLAQQAALEMPALLELIDGPWEHEQGLETARKIVRAFLRHWETHRAVLLIRNLAADHGDPRFQEARRAALLPVLDRLAECVARFQPSEEQGARLHPFAAAAAIVSLLERLSAHPRELAQRGVSQEVLLDTCALIVLQVVTGGGSKS